MFNVCRRCTSADELIVGAKSRLRSQWQNNYKEVMVKLARQSSFQVEGSLRVDRSQLPRNQVEVTKKFLSGMLSLGGGLQGLVKLAKGSSTSRDGPSIVLGS